ncbi:MAG: M50 family metallopeptidase [Verrucomicrobia bacterium]|nr:M50 family metallopeptidase [Verrucomicrobiota bacterium]
MIRLFKISGITVYLHFSWFVIAAIEVTQFAGRYRSPVWGALEYLALFGIVLFHEFGHALACRQVGGIANRIVLWPLGGIAFVDPPRRAGAYLWSIAAGPLINVALVPVFNAAVAIISQRQSVLASTDVLRFVSSLQYINYGLLIFNLLPIFPLDGGQILRALLWYPFGEIRSLQISSVLGLAGAGLLALVGLSWHSFWIAILAFFLLSRAAYGWQQAKAMIAAEEHGVMVSPSPSAAAEELRR